MHNAVLATGELPNLVMIMLGSFGLQSLKIDL